MNIEPCLGCNWLYHVESCIFMCFWIHFRSVKQIFAPMFITHIDLYLLMLSFWLWLEGFLMTHWHAHWSVYRSTLTKDSSCSRWQLTQGSTTGQCVENSRLQSAQPSVRCLYNVQAFKAQRYTWKRQVESLRASVDECLQENNPFQTQPGRCIYELTVIAIACTRFMQDQVRQKSQHWLGSSGMKSYLYLKNYWHLIAAWRRKVSFFLVVWHLVYGPHSSECKPHTQK